LILAIEQRKKWELRVITKGFKIKLIGNDKLRLGPKEKLTPALINKAKNIKQHLLRPYNFNHLKNFVIPVVIATVEHAIHQLPNSLLNMQSIKNLKF